MNFNQDIWKKIESEYLSGEKIIARLAVPEMSRKLYAGIDSMKQRHLLVPIEKDEEDYNDSESKGMSISTRKLIIKRAEQKRYIDIICQDVSGHIIFDAIAKDIAEKLDKGIPREVVANVIGKWRNFWKKTSQEIMSSNEIIGLFAELWFLYKWLLPYLENFEAIKRWRGPFSSRHDFEWKGTSVEVKSTTNVQCRVHKIHGIEQLSPPENGDLFLFSLRLREEQGSEMTLPNLIKLCKDFLGDDIESLSKFENILAIAGYSPFYDKEYSKFKFRVVDEKLYRVTKDFPHLERSSFINDVPSGIGVIEYSINLDGYDNLCLATSPNEISSQFSK